MEAAAQHTNASARVGLLTSHDVWVTNLLGPLRCLLCEHLQIPNNGRVTGLTSNRKSNLLLVNCHDRSIRLFELQPPASSPEQQQQQQQGGQQPEAVGWDEQAVRQRLAGIDFKVCKMQLVAYLRTLLPYWALQHHACL
jgi:hypothetical protein